MIVKIKCVNGNIEVVKTDKYVISSIRYFDPRIVSVYLYSNSGRLLEKKTRFMPLFYRYVTARTYKVRSEIERIENEERTSRTPLTAENLG